MAITRTETQVLWSAASSVSVTTGSSQTSDEFNLDAATFQSRITLKADNSTTPAADDQIYCWLLESSGDPDGSSTDEFSTTGHAQFLCILDTNLEDPAIRTVPFPLPQSGAKLYCEGSTAGTTNAITVSASISEQLG